MFGPEPVSALQKFYIHKCDSNGTPKNKTLYVLTQIEDMQHHRSFRKVCSASKKKKNPLGNVSYDHELVEKA